MESSTPLERAYAEPIARSSSGILTVTEGRIRRLFCFGSGKLLFVASNIIEEQFEEFLVREEWIHVGDRAKAKLESSRAECTVWDWFVESGTLTSEQLNATADVPGSFVYNPGLGTVLQTGNNQTLQVDFTPDDTVNFLAATLTVQMDVAPGDPTVAIVSPADGSTITPLSDLVIKAQASDNSGIAKVEFFEGQNKLGEVLTEPFNYTWMSIPLGDYVLTAVATDTSGRTATSETVTIGVPPSPSSLEISPSTGQITVGLVGENGVTYEVQVSTNLTTWTTLTTITGTGGEVPVIDSMLASQVGQRFYRLVPISP